jgi:aryl-alcohol dehydrogenase-like predicted oxidoreductase
MDQVRLGNTGLKVSRLCLGCMTYGSPEWRSWVLDLEQSKPFFRSAIEKGITFFDTANVYSIGRSEEVTGECLRELARREEIVVATKVNGPMGKGANEKGLSRKAIMAQIDASLRRLGMDYVDLYQIHRFDYETPIEETLEALNDVVKAGKARYIGASSMYAWQFGKMLAASRATPSAPAPTSSPRASISATPTSRWSMRWVRSPRPAASRTCRWRWPGS